MAWWEARCRKYYTFFTIGSLRPRLDLWRKNNNCNDSLLCRNYRSQGYSPYYAAIIDLKFILLLCRFSVAWWSYTFPMTTASLATIKYAEQEPSPISKGLAVTLSLLSSAMVSALLILTLLHAVLWKSLFPNDVAIAITKKRSNALKSGKLKRRPYDIRQWTRQTPFALVTSSMNKNSKQQDQGSVFPYVGKNAEQHDQKSPIN